jgi:predicted permease
MGVFRELVFMLRKLRRSEAERELDEEIRSHIEMEVELNLERGLDAVEARRQALVKFGSLHAAREESRREWGLVWIETLWQDVRFGARLLVKSRAFTAVAVGTLAVGIGASTAIFSVVDAVLLRRLPFAEPERIVTLWENNVKDGIARDDVSPANFLDWRERATSFEKIAFANPYSLDYMNEGEPETWESALVSDGFFRVLDVNALHGRTFLPEEYESGRDGVVVLGYPLWRDRFGGDPGVVGSTIALDGKPMTIVGVMPPEFKLNLFEREKLLWAPQVPDESFRKQRRATYLKVVGRLAPGVTVEAASAEMDAIASNLAAELPESNSGVGVATVPLEEQIVGPARPALVVLFAAVGLVLLVACANVANLLLARSGAREREIALRAAIGASRVRLVRQFVVESLVVAALACAAGVALAWAGLRLILAFAPDDIPRLERAALDPQALAFAAGVSTLTVFLFGLVPALHASKPDLNAPLKEMARSATGGALRGRLRGALVVTEIALALVLLVGAGLLGRSFMRLIEVDPGFAVERVVALQVFVWDRYDSPEKRANYVDEVISRVSTVPGVEAAGVTTALPFLESSAMTSYPFLVEGRPAPATGAEPTVFVTVADAGYFEVTGVPLVAGRSFDSRDTSRASPVVMINETMARRHWPGENPVGAKVMFASAGRGGRPATVYEIVGVVGDLRHEGLDREPHSELFRPYAQSQSGSIIFAVRTSADPATLIPTLKARLWEVNATQPIYNASAAGDLVSASLRTRRFSLTLVGFFAVVALALAVVGIYGVMSYVTSHRTREIGVRMAFGAQKADVVRLILGEGARMTLAGVCLGLLGSLALTRYLTSMLFGVAPYDAQTFVAVSALLVAVALLACYLPARRATKLDPMTVLRSE